MNNKIILSPIDFYNLIDSGDLTIGNFIKTNRCIPAISDKRENGRAMIDLNFDNEKDMIWFKLKYL